MSEVKTDKVSSITTNGDLTLDPNGTGDVIVASGHKVGVSTTSPSSVLHVYDSSNAKINMETSTNTAFIGNISGSMEMQSADIIKFLTSGANERMRIDSSGTVLIGTSSAAATGSKLEMKTASSTANVLYMLKSGQVEMTMGFKSGTDSNFYIGTGSTTIGTNGVYLANTANSWTSISDERKKTVVENITNASQKVSDLRSVIGYFNHDENQTRKPFLIAQDVQAVLPEAVNVQSDEDGTLGLSYTDVIPLLTAALKESIAKIETLETQRADLETRVAALEAN